MTVFKVSNMKCIHCVKRITDALANAKIEGTVELESKTVKVADEDAAKVAEILDDLGFEAEQEK